VGGHSSLAVWQYVIISMDLTTKDSIHLFMSLITFSKPKALIFLLDFRVIRCFVDARNIFEFFDQLCYVHTFPAIRLGPKQIVEESPTAIVATRTCTPINSPSSAAVFQTDPAIVVSMGLCKPTIVLKI